MKSKSLKISCILFILLSVIGFSSCESSKTKAARESNPYFLADMDAIYVGEIVALNKQNFFKPKAIDIGVDFYPRTSSVSFRFKDGMNKVMLTFEPEEYKALCESVDKYTAIKEADGFEKGYKPGRKNRFYKGNVYTAWGATGYGREVKAPFDTNYQWLEVNDVTNPYFRIEVQATDFPEEEHVASPTVSLYFTPSQAIAIKNVINMESVKQEIEDFNKAAYSFE